MTILVFSLSGCGGGQPSKPSAPRSEPPSATRADPPDSRPVILAFGDSLTAGSGLPSGSGYPELLQAELDARGYRYRVVNAGVGGDTTSNGLARLPSALRLEPEIVILELGGNDGLQGFPVDSMRANLDEMLAAFKMSGAAVILGGMTLPRNFGRDYIGAFEKVYPELAAKHSVTLIPFFLEGAAGNPSLMLEDGIHPNHEGYRVLVANLMPFLEPLLKK
jgi:acyl-CoA thioesterase-1